MFVDRGDVGADAADALFRSALDRGIEPFRDAAKRLYATIAVNEHKEHHALNSRAVRVWLQQIHRADTGHLPNRNALAHVMERLEAAALFDGPDAQDVRPTRRARRRRDLHRSR